MSEHTRTLRPKEDRPPHQFSTNDYLGLSTHPKILEVINAALSTHGWGSTGSRLLSGDRNCLHTLEEQLAEWIGKPACLLFNTGYGLNLSVISSLFTAKDIIFADKYVHASIIDGIRLSGAKCFRYAHQDFSHLNQLLKKHRNDFENALIISESVFSMDGDLTPIPELLSLKTRFNAQLYIDEAHAIGVYGNNGEGVIGKKLASEVDFIVGTFGKSFGGVGAFIACDPIYKTQLINQARSLIYSTALPPVFAIAAQTALDLIKSGSLGQNLQKITTDFRAQLLKKRVPILGNTHIIPILAGSSETALFWSAQLAEAGFDIPAIRYPTVPKNQARLRLSLSLGHSQKERDSLSQELGKIC